MEINDKNKKESHSAETTLSPLRLGIDIGSTSIKGILLNSENRVLFHKYSRHHAAILPVLLELLKEVSTVIQDEPVQLMFTGSIGMGIAERIGASFNQEVISSIKFINELYPDVKTFIDIGGEDAKMIFFNENQQPDIRMNGSCAGGTGAFIDQMSTLLAIPIEELNSYAEKAETIYPIASRCGVFSKTDIQNLIARNANKNDITGSIFHAVALQVISSLSRGYDVQPKVFFCGAPFAFLPTLKQSFLKLLQISESEVITTPYPELVPAYGTALSVKPDTQKKTIQEWIRQIDDLQHAAIVFEDSELLPRLFDSDQEREVWLNHNVSVNIPERNSNTISEDEALFLGVDSGSTTTKIVIINQKKEILFHYYAKNGGDAIGAFKKGLSCFKEQMDEQGKNIAFRSSSVTGYGENLLKVAFDLHHGMVETMAHYTAAKEISPDVGFILDIGGQDMKAIFVENGAIRRIEINEACSSGCGSFIEGFAQMLSMSVQDFALLACQSKAPADLGTRCTVFMNSKVKQSLREGCPIEDIAAGLSYSVIKNCLFKVLKLKSVEELGGTVVVQGGTFRNPSIIRCLELLTKKEVHVSNFPELMGAYGAAIYALNQDETAEKAPLPMNEILNVNTFETTNLSCKGCENRCSIKKFIFSNQKPYFSGNKCERIFSNSEDKEEKGVNFHEIKYNMLFDREDHLEKPLFTMGIPRGLILYEDYPFWHTLLTECNIQPLLSGVTTVAQYEKGVKTIMADNICFPAKLMHGHIMYLIKKNVDRILYPYNVYERKEDEKAVNSYNCPIVTAYSDVLNSAMETEDRYGIPIDSPVLNFNDKRLLHKSLSEYLSQFDISERTISRAIRKALEVQHDFEKSLYVKSLEIYEEALRNNKPIIVLAGRPYHIDPLIQHKISEAISDMGATVINEDVVRDIAASAFDDTDSVTQWAFPNRIMNCAKWVGEQPAHVHFVQITSFGCGPDAFVNEEIKQILQAKGKNLTLLKVDDVNNIGSLKLRIRSLLESSKGVEKALAKPNYHTPPFTVKDRHRKVIAPYFAEGYSELIPPLFKIMGIDIENLPPSDVTSNELGLLYANNEVCYPATLVVGDIMKALHSGKYNPDEIAVAITQTGGQCRATNYISLIKKALVAGGFGNIPVVSVSFGKGIINEQPGFNLDWSKCLMTAYHALLFVDALSKLYYPAAVREKEKGAAKRIRDKYLHSAQKLVEVKDQQGLLELIDSAIDEFMLIIDETIKAPAIGVVGEIYVKYNSFSHKNVVDWLIEQGIEVVAPSMYNFMMAEFINNQTKKRKNMSRLGIPLFLSDMIFKFARKFALKFDKICARYSYYRPFSNLQEDAENASKIINLAAQFGEGWLIPAEIAGFAEQNINNAISLQPFGCIANHVISKGIEKRIKKTYPKMNLLFLDFDGGTSEANVLNRLHFMIDGCKKNV
ncbi:acyl-CoA dehydratase activase-related protein [Bacteroidales bacterium OttesenSCG-928-B11]|nr:acyl-CoA dehydratase activase-related protein [Bacteroidales bacterium OttesenSCG-928-C03]MDL2312473.1 acyl-CoA dehydratase activase-related protein [Bacteroidales bacterium OttesenSCG-928-B11]MDL2326538.1 acyl-CoA dehydratase activase-related protein [Bacteroidales bacterium OttesenSCG-928-A14]